MNDKAIEAAARAMMEYNEKLHWLELARAACTAYERTMWIQIESAPKLKRVLCYVPIKNHRLVIAVLSKDGIWLDERLNPMPFTPTHWRQLPKHPENEK